MHEGRVVHFEDSETFRESVADHLEIQDSAHQIVGEAGDLPSALAALERISRGELEANVILLDGNLTSATNGSDARTITGRIGELGLAVRVVGLSSDAMEKYGVQVDADITKKSFTGALLKEVLDELSEPEVKE